VSVIAPVDRAGGIMPVARRDHAHAPGAGDEPDGRERPAGRDPGDGRRHAPPAAEAPAGARHSPSGKIVDTFAM
jgi:hypothetical protein